jgi:hypothetical protein
MFAWVPVVLGLFLFGCSLPLMFAILMEIAHDPEMLWGFIKLLEPVWIAATPIFVFCALYVLCEFSEWLVRLHAVRSMADRG